MSHYVYALASQNCDWIYVGMSNDVIRRFHEHQRGFEKTTRPYKPFVLIYTEVCEDRSSARLREKYWKAASGKRKLRFMRDDIFGRFEPA